MRAPSIKGVVISSGVALLACGLVACGSTSDKNTTSSSSGAGPSIDVTIAHGGVTPTNATLEAKVGQPITFHVTSDAPDELHVHSVPDHEFEIAAAPNQTFQFSADVPGNVDVELHHLDRTVATIHVRP